MLKRLSLLTLVITMVGFIPTLAFNQGRLLIESDSLKQFIPFVYELKRMLASGAPLWTWNSFFGDSFLPAYSYYTVTNPFAWLSCLFPYRWLMEGIMMVQLLKYLCLSWVAYAYFRKVRFSKELSAVGALMYTFSSWGIMSIAYWTFLVPMMVFPVMLIAVEHFLQGGRYRNVCLAGAVFLAAFVNWYFLSCNLIACALYALCRLFGGKYAVKCRLLAKGLCDVLLGLCLAAIVLIPVLLFMSGSARENFSLGNGLEITYATTIRIIWAILPKLSDFSNTSNATFFPVAGLFFVSVYLIRRRDWLTVLLVIAIVLYLTPLNGIFLLFTSVFYTRWAYALILFFIVATLKVVEGQFFRVSDYRKYLLVLVSIVLAVLCGLVVMGFVDHIPGRFAEKLKSCIVPLLLLAVNMLFLWRYVRSRRTTVLLAGVAVCAALQFAVSTADTEVQLSYITDISQKPHWLSKREYYDLWHRKYFLDNDYPVNKKPFHWRTDFYCHVRNMAMLKNSPSIESYASCYNKEIEPLILATDRKIASYKNNTKPKPYTRGSFDALMSVRTVVDYKDPDKYPLEMEGLQLVSRNWNYDVYSYKYYIPMGFTYDTFVSSRDMERYNEDVSTLRDVPRQMLANLSVRPEDETVFSKYLKKGSLNLSPSIEEQWKSLSLDSLCHERRKQTCDWFAGDTRGFSAHVNMRKANMMFFSVPFDPGFTATVDGRETKIYNVNLGLSAIELGKGAHDIRFEFFPKGLKEGAAVSLASLLCMLALFCKERRHVQPQK